MPKHSILVADDIENQTDSGKRRSQAIRGAASFFAQRLNVGTELLYVEDIHAYPHDRFDALRIREWHSQHQKRLEELSKRYQDPVIYSLKIGSPAELILKAVRSTPSPELVVVGTQGRKGLKRLLIGSVAEEVIRYAKRPVMVIGPEAWEKSWNVNAKKQLKILLATDLSKNSRAAEHYALSLAKRMGAAIVLFHCLGESFKRILTDCSMVSGWVPLNLEEILAGIQEESVKAIEQKARFFEKHDVPCYYKIDDKQIPSACSIYQEGAKDYSFVVMGTHGRNALLNAFFGSTARETILNASIPVITVHSVKYKL
ncbi:MAG TPA: universal stress protein [Nitrospirota bacterium]|nr:universal stress protein [Nitrospirota bacterium]